MTTFLLQAKQQPPEHRFAYIGIPHDAATSIGNPGARFAPQALRESLRGVFEWRLREGKLADIDELNPVYDTPARATALLAARLMLDFITARVRGS